MHPAPPTRAPSPPHRRAAVRRFASDASVRVALLSVTAAGVGLDFSSASVVVFAGGLKGAAWGLAQQLGGSCLPHTVNLRVLLCVALLAMACASTELDCGARHPAPLPSSPPRAA